MYQPQFSLVNERHEVLIDQGETEIFHWSLRERKGKIVHN